MQSDAYSGNIENKMVDDSAWHDHQVILLADEQEDEQEEK